MKATQTAQHTPGPWRVGDAGYTVFGPPVRDAKYPDALPERIATMPAYGKKNARLIAAAPELLAALKDCVESLRRLNDSDGAYRTTCIEQARAAIARATNG